MLIFPRKNESLLLNKGAPDGSLIRVHPSGWVQTHLFTEWFEMFIDSTNPTETNPVLLVLDGHYTHTRNINVINLAREHHVTIISLPPHTTHRLQPLDRSYMGAFKTYYSEAIRVFMHTYARPPNHYDIAALFNTAFVQCQTALIAKNGFKTTGICPFNRNIFPDSLFKKEELKKMSKADNNERVDVQVDLQADGQVDLQANGQADEQANGQANVQDGDHSRPPSQHVSPKDIHPVPQLKKKTSNKGPKGTNAALITGSPYKAELEASLKRIAEREAAKKAAEKAAAKNGAPVRGKSKGRKRLAAKRTLDFKGAEDQSATSNKVKRRGCPPKKLSLDSEDSANESDPTSDKPKRRRRPPAKLKIASESENSANEDDPLPCGSPDKSSTTPVKSKRPEHQSTKRAQQTVDNSVANDRKTVPKSKRCGRPAQKRSVEIPSTSSGFRGSNHSHLAQRLRLPSSSSEEGAEDYSESDREDEVINAKPSKKDDPNAVCIFCCESHSSDRAGEEWVQCCICENWAHSACTDCETDFYACDYCKDS